MVVIPSALVFIIRDIDGLTELKLGLHYDTPVDKQSAIPLLCAFD